MIYDIRQFRFGESDVTKYDGLLSLMLTSSYRKLDEFSRRIE